MAFFFLILPVILSLSLLLLGREFVNDDTQFLLVNPDVARLKSFWDCFTFPFQPTKPVTNFVVALGLYLGHASVLGQKVVSLLFHLATCGALFALLREMWRDSRGAFLATLVFAVLPIHLETLGIAQFRGEVIATFCLLLALWLIEKKVSLIPVLLLQGVAFLSKEVLGVAFTLIVLLRSRKPAVVLGAVGWLGLIYLLFQQDKTVFYSYRGNVGLGAVPLAEHLVLAVRAFFEGTVKVVSGFGLSAVRLRDRGDLLPFIPWALRAVAGLALIGFSLYRLRRGDKDSFWIFFAWVAALGYLAVPNVNLGSEHYWYCASVGIAVCLVLGLSRLPRFGSLTLGTYILFLCISFSSRALDFETRLAFYGADWERHPEAGSTWLNLASAQSERGAPSTQTLPLVEKAKQLSPKEPGIPATEFSILAKEKRLEQLAALLRQMEIDAKVGNRTLSQFYLQYSLLLLNRGLCPEAAAAAGESLRFDAGNPFVHHTLSQMPCRG